MFTKLSPLQWSWKTILKDQDELINSMIKFKLNWIIFTIEFPSNWNSNNMKCWDVSAADIFIEQEIYFYKYGAIGLN